MTRVRAIPACILVLSTIAFVADSAIAKTVSIKGNSKKDVKSSCDGAYWPDSAGHTYGCVNKDGSGIVCGGVSKKDKKTCDTFREAPRCLPTRAQAVKAEMAEKAQKP
jgi:hypothetical protein